MAKTSQRRLQALAARATTRRVRRRLDASLSAWHVLTRGKRRRRQRLSSLVLRVLGRQLHATFIAWHQDVRRRQVQEHVVRVIGLRIARVALRHAFSLWAALSGALHAKRQRVYDFTRRCVAKWAAGATSRALERWRSDVAVRRSVRYKARWLALRAGARVTGAAFTAWATYTLTLLAAKDNAVLFAVRMMRFSAHKVRGRVGRAEVAANPQLEALYPKF